MASTVVLFSACGGGSSPDTDTKLTAKEFAFQQIGSYADNAQVAPSLKDYIDVGVTGVTADNLADINEAVKNLTAEDVDTTEEIQALADALSMVFPDTTSPVFTLPNTASVLENQTSAITLMATDETSAVTYSISGADASHFSIDPSSGVVTFITVPDYEIKQSFNFTVTATDEAGNAVTQDVMISISDIIEVQLPKKTGQTKSYDASGAEVLDNSIKDDGFYQSGTVPSYTRDDTTSIVTDHITGLQWQDDANVSTVRKEWLTRTNFYICKGLHGHTKDTSKCADTSGDTSATYCANLTLGGHDDWRLPTVNELMNIFDRGIANPVKDAGVFVNIGLYDYTTSSTVVLASYKSVAWGVSYAGTSYWQGKYLATHVRCVRNGQ